MELLPRSLEWLQPHEKVADTPELASVLSGKLYLSSSGWLLLSVPNALARGCFEAIDEPGAELPLKDGVFNAHISVMSADEVEQIGSDKITERGKSFHYSLGPIRTVRPPTWEGVSRVWYIEVKSSELQTLRKSYGLSALPHNGEYDFHITFAVRKTGVLHANEQSKAAHEELLKEARSLIQQAIGKRLAEPFKWQSEQGVLDNMQRYVGSIADNFRQNLSGLQTAAKYRSVFEPDYGWQRLRHVMNQGVPPEIQSPADTFLYHWLGN